MAWGDYWPVLSPILGALGGATVIAFSKRYLEERAKTLATKHDIGELQKQLRENTEIAKGVEQTYARADVLWRSELEYRERQLSELYGPAYGYVKTSKDLFHLWVEGKTPEINLTVKRWLTKQNEFMRDLLISKSHLIEGTQMPESMCRFATSTLVFDFYASPTEEGQVPERLRSDPRAIYPHDFDEHVIETTERLKARIDQLHRKYSAPL
jgi:hypothetical protein